MLLFGFQGLEFTQHILIGVLQTLARKYHRKTYIKPDKRASQTEREKESEKGWKWGGREMDRARYREDKTNIHKTATNNDTQR